MASLLMVKILIYVNYFKRFGMSVNIHQSILTLGDSKGYLCLLSVNSNDIKLSNINSEP